MHLVNKKWVALGAFAALGILLATFSGVFDEKRKPLLRAKPEPYQGDQYIVQAQPVASSDIVSASVVARENTLVASRILAQLQTLEVRAGQLVKQGQLLATLDGAELRAALQEIRAQSKANEAQLLQAKKQLTRSDALFAKGLIAKNIIDERQSKVDELEARHLALSEQLNGAQVALSYTQLRAPIAGLVVERLQEPGVMLSPGVPIVEIFNPASLQISGAVRSNLAGQLSIGEPLQVKLDALGKSVIGHVSEIVPVADSLARQFEIKLDITPPKGAKPGMYAQITLPTELVSRVVVPRQLVYQTGQLSMVYVVEQGIKQRRLIRLGRQLNDKVVVLSGLKSGEILAVTPSISS
ncbi:efflux RND transporter periplasmic adaptor subunit [Pseudoalteromonas luteoviolacea]|uniref:efflux RND transporter periplasmic adaptor subunit n=1 Tax=Pseudoalteromonas luteoviolacea TaxID=43657 RepID=UPI001B36D852|nr:efflux RND transporter periplasmic adaptor subunit [Pseudoalteromonas luteoviolacea]MBQ4839962.1 efflux RND transporter periplasmic adaptor subunit [Pseudoalteromonas luteoviolacea]